MLTVPIGIYYNLKVLCFNPPTLSNVSMTQYLYHPLPQTYLIPAQSLNPPPAPACFASYSLSIEKEN